MNCALYDNPSSDPYDLYTFTNPDAAPRQVSVAVTVNCAEGYSYAYLGSFNPANLCASLLGGENGPGSASYTFNVPANATFVVEVEGYPGRGPVPPTASP